MPIYEFHCKDCDADSEVLVRATSWKGTKCPRCGSTRLVKKLSVFAAARSESPAMPSTPCGADPGSCCGGACRMDN